LNAKAFGLERLRPLQVCEVGSQNIMEAMLHDEELPYGAPPLSEQEKSALICARSCKGDWGPVFVYGSMLFPTSWGNLVGYLPEMSCATLRGYERRCFHTGGFAGVFKNEGKAVIGMLVYGLKPMDRFMLDAVVDDSFLMIEVGVEPTGDSEPRLMVTECGDLEFNGCYLPDGMKEGRPCYRREEPDKRGVHRTIHFESGQWHFCKDYLGFFYKSDWDGLKPPLDGWEIDADGLTPLPVIAKEPMTIECSTYVLRESCMDALGSEDWDFEGFGDTWLNGFARLCKDTQVRLKAEQMPDDLLKEMALARRRRETGFEGEGGDRPDLAVNPDDPDAIDSRLGVKFPRGIIRLDAAVPDQHIHDESWVKPKENDDATGRTPEEERQHLEENEKSELSKRRKTRGVKYPPEATHRDAGAVLEKLRYGLIKLHGEDQRPFFESGLPSTKGSDFVVVSIPYGHFGWYARACIICATFRIGLAEVSVPHFQEIWLYVWKRNVERAVKANKTLIFLTQMEMYGGPEEKPGIGNLEFLQSVQVLHLRQQGYKFVAMDIMDFCRDLQPVLSGAMENNFDAVEQALMSRREIPVPLVNVCDHTGRTAMHYVARLGPSERVIRMLSDAGESVDSPQWCCDEFGAGWTPLMYAVKYGPPRMVRVLFENGADAHVKNDAGQTVFQLVRGRADNERMLSQCHFKCCRTCKKDEMAKPLPDNAVEGHGWLWTLSFV